MPRGENLPKRQKGERVGGRQKGTPNKTTVAVKQAIQQVFDDIGGVEKMASWAQDNPGEFYTKVYPKLLPLDVDLKVQASLAKRILEARTRERSRG